MVWAGAHKLVWAGAHKYETLFPIEWGLSKELIKFELPPWNIATMLVHQTFQSARIFPSYNPEVLGCFIFRMTQDSDMWSIRFQHSCIIRCKPLWVGIAWCPSEPNNSIQCTVKSGFYSYIVSRRHFVTWTWQYFNDLDNPLMTKFDVEVWSLRRETWSTRPLRCWANTYQYTIEESVHRES